MKQVELSDTEYMLLHMAGPTGARFTITAAPL